MSTQESKENNWVRILRIVGVVLLAWAIITLISGLVLADVGPEIEGRTMYFEDTGIAGYGTLAWIGVVLGAVLMIVSYLFGRQATG